MDRWTMKELAEISNKQFILRLIQERLNKLTNPYAPLTARLNTLKGWAESLPEEKQETTAVETKLPEGKTGRFYFPVELVGSGKDAGEAWEDACEGFARDNRPTPDEYRVEIDTSLEET